MKKLLSIVIFFALLAGCAYSCAEDIDLKSMSFEELIDLDTRLKAELLTRPETEDVIFVPGEYLVGEDIEPGTYYVRYATGSANCGSIRVYADATEEKRIYSESSYEVRQDQYKITLESGNLVKIEDSGMAFSLTEKKYTPVEGVIVQPGVYEVGVDIPAGRYTCNYNGHSHTRVRVYPNAEEMEESFGTKVVDETVSISDDSLSVILKEGYYLSIENNYCIMQKNETSISFD